MLLQCQECRDNHEEDCVLNITRQALELALLGENIPYEGSALLYLVAVGKDNPGIGEQLLSKYKEYKQLRQAGPR